MIGLLLPNRAKPADFSCKSCGNGRKIPVWRRLISAMPDFLDGMMVPARRMGPSSSPSSQPFAGHQSLRLPQVCADLDPPTYKQNRRPAHPACFHGGAWRDACDCYPSPPREAHSSSKPKFQKSGQTLVCLPLPNAAPVKCSNRKRPARKSDADGRGLRGCFSAFSIRATSAGRIFSHALALQPRCDHFGLEKVRQKVRLIATQPGSSPAKAPLTRKRERRRMYAARPVSSTAAAHVPGSGIGSPPTL